MSGLEKLLDAATDRVNAADLYSESEGRAEAYRRGLLDAAGELGINTGRLLMQQDEDLLARVVDDITRAIGERIPPVWHVPSTGGDS